MLIFGLNQEDLYPSSSSLFVSERNEIDLVQCEKNHLCKKPVKRLIRENFLLHFFTFLFNRFEQGRFYIF